MLKLMLVKFELKLKMMKMTDMVHGDDLASSGFVRMICKGLQEDSQLLLSPDFKSFWLFIMCCMPRLFPRSNEILHRSHLFRQLPKDCKMTAKFRFLVTLSFYGLSSCAASSCFLGAMRYCIGYIYSDQTR